MHMTDDSSLADLCLRVAGTVGKAWKKYRRQLPSEVRDSMRQLLLDLRLHVIPKEDLACSAIGKARYDRLSLVIWIAERAYVVPFCQSGEQFLPVIQIAGPMSGILALLQMILFDAATVTASFHCPTFMQKLH